MQSNKTILNTKLTPVQLQQRLIYTQSELNKYKKQVEKYQNDYYYNMIDELKAKESQWETERLELQSELDKSLNQLHILQAELAELKQRQKEKAEEHSAKVEEQEPIKEKDVQLDISLNEDNQTKNQDWFLRSVKNPKRED